MKRNTKLIKLAMLAATVVLFGLCGAIAAQTTQPENSSAPAQAQTPELQANQMTDLRPLDLKPDQIQKIRAINLELKDERQAAGLKLRQTQRALTEAIESPSPDESLIAQRSREVAEAQANTIRLRSLTEARILQVLTPEQRVRLREMRQRNLALRRERQQGAPNGLNQRQQGLQRDPNNPVLTPAQRRALRRQQKP
ncbi:MAG TPA: periplasmic heavy metal sensor [Pyrinomonadaceae bacterium]|nr:periplasmic heavy metal sensor [Pyrinomonadaceae bacterium]